MSNLYYMVKLQPDSITFKVNISAAETDLWEGSRGEQMGQWHRVSLQWEEHHFLLWLLLIRIRVRTQLNASCGCCYSLSTFSVNLCVVAFSAQIDLYPCTICHRKKHTLRIFALLFCCQICLWLFFGQNLWQFYLALCFVFVGHGRQPCGEKILCFCRVEVLSNSGSLVAMIENEVI